MKSLLRPAAATTAKFEYRHKYGWHTVGRLFVHTPPELRAHHTPVIKNKTTD